MFKGTDVEASKPQGVESFMNESQIRHNFIKKVYSILSAQVAFTIFVVVLSLNVDDLKHFIIENIRLLYISCSIASLALLIALQCIESLRRSYPINYIMLFIFTCLASVEVSALSVISKTENVYTACYLTAGLFILLTGFAYMNIFDISNMGAVLCWSGLILMILSFGLYIAALVFPIYLKPLHMILCCFVLLLTMVYIVYDTQIIIGEGKVKLSEEEYILAAIFLYIDIITLFKTILMLLNDSDS